MSAYFTDPKTESLVLQVPDPFAIRDAIPQSKTIVHDDFNVIVRWTLANVQTLRAMGFDVPEPKHVWPGPYQPFPHQLEMIDHRLKHKRCFDLSEQGAMKTAPSLWAADKMIHQGIIQKVLVICPLSTVDEVWQKGIHSVLMHRGCAIVHGTREQRERALNSNADFYIVNHDATRIGWLRRAIKRRTDIGLIIMDEGGMFRDGTREKFKQLREMIRSDQRVWWLTGTPTPNGPADAWSQCQIINPNGVPALFSTWRDSVMVKEGPFRWVPRRGSKEMVFQAMQPAIRFMKSDTNLNLPPVTTINLKCELTPEQQKAFHFMQLRQRADIGDREISAVHAADELGKLRQILAGVVKDTATGKYLVLPCAPRIKVLREAIEGAASKVLVIVPFKGIINHLEEHVSKFTTCAVLNGDVSPKRRNEIIHAFKTTANPHVLLCHPKVMAHGLNLTEADRTIFYAPIFSTDEFEQVIERFNRMGQTRKMTIIRIAANFVELDIYDAVDNKALNQRGILDLYRNVTARAA